MITRRELLGMAASASLLRQDSVALASSRPGADGGSIQLTLQTRDQQGTPHTTTERVDPRKVAIMAIDVWDYNVCRTWRTRAESLIPRFNQSFEAARKLGMTIVFSPTNSMRDLNESPQRKAALAIPNYPMPASEKLPDPYPWILRYTLLCECGEGESCFCTNNTNNQHPDLKMAEGDYIALFRQDTYNVLKERGITHIIYTGFASNLCLWTKPPGMKSMRQLGFRCLIARDLNEAQTGYIPESFNPNTGTAQVNELIERDLAPSINMEETMRHAGAWEGEPVLDYVQIAPWGRLFGGAGFCHPIEVELRCRFAPAAQIRYQLDGDDPTPASELYRGPITIKEPTKLKTAGFKGEKQVTRVSRAEFWKYPPTPDPPEIFVSDLAPVRESVGEIVPRSYAIKRAARFNRSVVGNVLTNHDRKFFKGIGVQAPSEMVFALKPGYKRFVAIAGVDDECTRWDNPDGLKLSPWQWARPIHGPTSFRICTIAFQVAIDGKVVAETPPLYNGEKAWGIDVEIPPGAQQIALRVKDVESRTADPHGHGDWLDAGFITS